VKLHLTIVKDADVGVVGGQTIVANVVVVHREKKPPHEFYYIIVYKKSMSTNDTLVWMTSLQGRVVDVGVNLMRKISQQSLARPPCVVFDVDSTLLINNDNGNDSFKVQRVGKTLFDFAAAENIPIYIVTARAKSKWALNYLVKQLRTLGYDDSKIKGIYMQSKEFIDNDDGGAKFKVEARKQIGATHTIVLNAGDRWGDVIDVEHTQTLADQIPSAENIYVGIRPAEPFTVYSVKFPEED
jgi:hypothetical protein